MCSHDSNHRKKTDTIIKVSRRPGHKIVAINQAGPSNAKCREEEARTILHNRLKSFDVHRRM